MIRSFRAQVFPFLRGTCEPRNGVINRPTSHTVDETVQKLKAILLAKGIKLFTVIDHSGEAESIGIKMPLSAQKFFPRNQ
jgi:hypothetical protein